MHQSFVDQSEVETTSIVFYPSQSETVLPRSKKLSSFRPMVKSHWLMQKIELESWGTDKIETNTVLL
jgi:hypothetical protein